MAAHDDTTPVMMDLVNYSATETLRDGRAVEIRAQRSQDREGMQAAIARSSSGSLHRRQDNMTGLFSLLCHWGDFCFRRVAEVWLPRWPFKFWNELVGIVGLDVAVSLLPLWQNGLFSLRFLVRN